jgi:hypothetical protein
MLKHKFSIRQETVIYAFLWFLLFAIPLMAEWLSIHSGEDDEFSLHVVLRAWRGLLPFFLLFLVHNWLLAPLVVHQRRTGRYLLGVALLVLVFILYQCSNLSPHPNDKFGPPRFEPIDKEIRSNDGFRPKSPQKRHSDKGSDVFGADNQRDHHPKHHGHLQQRHPPGPKPITNERNILAVIVLISMLGMNLGIKYYYRQRDNDEKLRELERQNLEHQLLYLRHQVNPHFLMNTLNNIHALIDIDTEKAQVAVVELSRLMRYALYDAERQSVSIQKEVDFLGNFLALMRIRLDNQVDIRFDVPSPLPCAFVPPLLFISFVENAFKHGISYRHPSFVHIHFEIENRRITFSCINSRVDADTTNGVSDSTTSSATTPEQTPGGLGLRNVRQRLDLLFPSDYQLDIQENAATYAVRLEIPLKLTE